MQVSLDQKIFVGFGVALALLLIIGFVSYTTTLHSIDSFKWVNHSREVLSQTEVLSSKVFEAGDQARSYLITGSDSFLKTFSSDLDEIMMDFRKLKKLTGDNPVQQQNLAKLEPLLILKVQIMKEYVAFKNDHKKLSSDEVLKEFKEGQETIDKLKQVLEAIKGTEVQLLNERQVEETRVTSNLIYFIVLSSILGVGFLGAAGVVIHRDYQKRVEAENKLQEHASRISHLYDHAPCGYHSLGPDGKFLEINQTELGWLGYSKDEVVGKVKFEDILAPISVQVYHDNWPIYLERGEVRDVEFLIRGKSGGERWVLLSSIANRDEEGNFVSTRTTMFDITDRKRIEQEFQDAQLKYMAELEGLNKELEAFSYSVSHDLRAPLRHIDGYVQLLRKNCEDKLDDKSRRYLQVVSESVIKMGKLIDDLLHFSRMGRTELSKSKVSLDSAVQEVLSELTPDMQDRNIKWNIEKLPVVEADRSMLHLVLMNLFSNAVKYTRDRSPAEICVSGRAQEGEFVFDIRDNGAGFDMQYADKLFGVFQRLHRSEDFQGTGIGLASVRRIISRHGGRVWAEGRVDEGATFSFSLPYLASNGVHYENKT
jgi:PAS domain S-box-containing protein